MTIWLRTDWLRAGTRYVAGSLLVADYDQFLAGTAELRVVFEPDAHTSLGQYAWTRDRLVVVTRVDVASRVQVVTPGSWDAQPVEGVPDNTDTVISATDEFSNEIFLYSDGFDTPPRLLHGTAGEPVHVIKSAPAMFDADDIVVTQNFATSADGTSIPYFVVGHRDAGGPGPTLLSGYGAYGMSMIPGYAGARGPAVAGPWRYLRSGEHPGRRRVWTRLAHPDHARGQTQGRRGLRRRRRGSRGARHHHRRAARRGPAAALVVC